MYAAEWAINKCICCVRVRCATKHFVAHSFLLLLTATALLSNGTKTPCNAEISRLSARTKNIFKRGAAFSALENLSYEYCFYPGGWGISKGLVFINVKESRLLLTQLSCVFLH
jgi:hypothetical protein